MDVNERIELIKNQLLNKFHPKRIILFGSAAKGTYNKDSDLDLCIIQDYENKRSLLTDIYTELDCNFPYDIILYSEREWHDNVDDKGSFAHIINNTGVQIYG